MGKKSMVAKATEQAPIAIGIAWYKPEEWAWLRAVSEDRNELEASYDEWVANVEDAIGKMRLIGLNPVKVDVKVAELLQWCHVNGCPVNGKSRASFASEKVHELYKTREEGGNTR